MSETCWTATSCLVTQTQLFVLVMCMRSYPLHTHGPKLQVMQRRKSDWICRVQRKGSRHFCIIGVKLRFPYCLMCEPQPEAPHPGVAHVDVLYTTYLTRPVGGKGLDDTKQCRQERQYRYIWSTHHPYMWALASMCGKQMRVQRCVQTCGIDFRWWHSIP